jgi:integrase
MAGKVTVRLINSMEPDATKDVYLWDGSLPGYGVRLKPSGVKSFVIQYRSPEGRSRRLTLGRTTVLTPDQARRMAQQTLAAVAQGADPVAERTNQHAEPIFADFAERYMTEYSIPRKKQSSAGNDRRLLNRYILPVWKDRKVRSIVREDVNKLHHDMRATPMQANKVIALISKMMNLAEVWSLRPDGSNPCRHVSKFPEVGRRRYLSLEEFTWLGRALNTAEATETPEVLRAIRLLLLSGMRLGEVLTLRQEFIDREHGVLALPDSKTGAKTVILSAPALSLLAQDTRQHGWTFPGRDGHLITVRRPWDRVKALVDLLQVKAKVPVDQRISIVDVRIHDLRHSFASVGVGSGLSLPLIGGLLGHTQPQTTARYAHLANSPLKQATNQIGAIIDAALNPPTQTTPELPSGSPEV